MYQCRQITNILLNSKHNIRILGCANIVSPRRYVTTNETTVVKDGYVKKFMNAVGLLDQNRTRLKLSGYFLYESIPNRLSYSEWFNKCDLPDTFASWFLVTELHVWLLMVRCMYEDIGLVTSDKNKAKGDGYFIRNCLVEALWADVATRIKLLEGANPSLARKQVNELSEQFQAAIIGYDEGLSDDRVLAAAVWRRFYALAPDLDATHLENIVKFIRQQIMELEQIPSEQFKVTKAKINWLKVT